MTYDQTLPLGPSTIGEGSVVSESVQHRLGSSLLYSPAGLLFPFGMRSSPRLLLLPWLIRQRYQDCFGPPQGTQDDSQEAYPCASTDLRLAATCPQHASRHTGLFWQPVPVPKPATAFRVQFPSLWDSVPCFPVDLPLTALTPLRGKPPWPIHAGLAIRTRGRLSFSSRFCCDPTQPLSAKPFRAWRGPQSIPETLPSKGRPPPCTIRAIGLFVCL
jgi:hypothetical protein